jgi:hypothetical protein
MRKRANNMPLLKDSYFARFAISPPSQKILHLQREVSGMWLTSLGDTAGSVTLWKQVDGLDFIIAAAMNFAPKELTPMNRPNGFASELLLFFREHKRRWLIPILLTFYVLGIVLSLLFVGVG